LLWVTGHPTYGVPWGQDRLFPIFLATLAVRQQTETISRDSNQVALPGGFENQIVLSDEFFREVTSHSIPTDLEAAKALSCAPAAWDLFMWLSV
jgi:hypothetical protein